MTADSFHDTVLALDAWEGLEVEGNARWGDADAGPTTRGRIARDWRQAPDMQRRGLLAAFVIRPEPPGAEGRGFVFLLHRDELLAASVTARRVAFVQGRTRIEVTVAGR